MFSVDFDPVSFHLPVLRIRSAHGTCHKRHLQRYAPPVAVQRQEGLAGRAGRLRRGRGEGSGGRAAGARRLRRRRLPADLRYRGALFDVRRSLTHVLHWEGKATNNLSGVRK